MELNALETLDTLFKEANAVIEKANRLQKQGTTVAESACGLALSKFSMWQLAKQVGGDVFQGCKRSEAAEVP